MSPLAIDMDGIFGERCRAILHAYEGLIGEEGCYQFAETRGYYIFYIQLVAETLQHFQSDKL